jgi:hypothetical protein
MLGGATKRTDLHFDSKGEVGLVSSGEERIHADNGEL